MKKNNVIVIGPNPKMKGGITTVIDGYRNNDLYNSEFDVHYFSSCIDGNKISKLFYMLIKFSVFPLYFLIIRPSIIHVHSAFGMSFFRKSFYIRFSKFFKCKVVNHIHGAEWDSFYKESNDRRKSKIKNVFSKCDYLIALSNEWKVRLSEVVPMEKIVVIPNFVSIKKNDIQKVEHSNINITFIGEFCERKGCFNIPKIVKESGLSNINVFFAGYGDRKTLESSISIIKSNNFEIIGFVNYEQKVRLLSKTDIFLFPSFNEGVPMVLLEAMSFGIPCISTDVGGIHSIINPEYGNGVLFNPLDFNSIGCELAKLINDKNYYKSISENSRKVAEFYSIENNVSTLLDIYRKVLGEEL